MTPRRVQRKRTKGQPSRVPKALWPYLDKEPEEYSAMLTPPPPPGGATVLALTATEAKALGILREHGDMLAREFALAMWPDSPGWNVVKTIGVGYGSSRGAGMARAAHGLLGKMKKRGLVQARYRKRDRGNTRWSVSPLAPGGAP